MLQSVEVVPVRATRAAVRRGVELHCELRVRGSARRETIVDLSPAGARVRTDVEVTIGDRVRIAFAHSRLGRRVETGARVAHVSRTDSGERAIGVAFAPLHRGLRRDLGARLRNVPPPLPSRAASRRELVWIDSLVTWSEDLGDRVNTFELSERLAALADDELEIASLATMLTGGVPRWRWAQST